MHEIQEIFERVTERYSMPIRVGSRCEANTYYRVDNLSAEELQICASYVADRIAKVCLPNLPDKIIKLPGAFTGLAELLSEELAPNDESLEVLPLEKLDPNNGGSTAIKGSNVVLVNDVITTARSCLEAHAKTTMMGANVLCWAALVDRTFGPGPVSVVAVLTGEPVTLLQEIP